MRDYYALVAFPKFEGQRANVINKGTIPASDAQRVELYKGVIKDMLWHWSYQREVEPYPDYAFKTDKEYERVFNDLRQMQKRRRRANLYDARAVMNTYCSQNKNVFVERPLPPYEKEDKREPSPRAKLLAYTRMNPDAELSTYDFPIQTARLKFPLEYSRLFDKNAGNYSDITMLYRIDFDATLVPEVVFTCSKTLAGEDAEFTMLESSDPYEIRQHIVDNVGPSAMVALVHAKID